MSDITLTADAKSITITPDPARGVLVTTTTDSKGTSTAVTPMPVEQINAATLTSKAQAALTANATYLAIGTPSAAQVAAQVASLTKQSNALIRLLVNKLDATTGT